MGFIKDLMDISKQYKANGEFYGAVYTVGNNTMLPGCVVAEVGQAEFMPYAFMKVDTI